MNNQDQRENIGDRPNLEETIEGAPVGRVVTTHGKNPLAEEESVKIDSSHGD